MAAAPPETASATHTPITTTPPGALFPPSRLLPFLTTDPPLHQILVCPVPRTGLVAVLALLRVLLPVVIDRLANDRFLRNAKVVHRSQHQDRLPDLGGVLREKCAERLDQLARPEQGHPAGR